jgi:hypothetical protein
MTDFELVLRIRPGLFYKNVGVRFDMLCFFRMLEEFGIKLGDDIGQISKTPFDELLAVAIFTGAESYAFHHKKRFQLSKSKVLSWVDNSIITRKQYKELGQMWLEFMQTFDEKKKVKAT